MEKNAWVILQIEENHLEDMGIPRGSSESKKVLDLVDAYLSKKIGIDLCLKEVKKVIGRVELNWILDVESELSGRPIRPSGQVSFSRYGRAFKQPWNYREDNRLLAAIWLYGLEDWNMIEKHVGSRNKAQCKQRWERGLDPRIRKEPWTKEEEKELTRLVNEYGNKWRIIAIELKHRTDVQCKRHWEHMLKAKPVEIEPPKPQEKNDPFSVLLSRFDNNLDFEKEIFALFDVWNDSY